MVCQVNGTLRLLLYAWRLLGPPAQITRGGGGKGGEGGGVLVYPVLRLFFAPPHPDGTLRMYRTGTRVRFTSVSIVRRGPLKVIVSNPSCEGKADNLI